MHHRLATFDLPRLFAIFVCLAFTSNSLVAGQPSSKLPIPDKEAQQKARELIRELYAKEYAAAEKEGSAKIQLALTLLSEGKETNDYPAGQFVLYREAHDLAADAGDSPTALQAIAELSLTFRIDPKEVFQMKIAALDQAAEAAASADAYHTVIDGAMALLEDALQNDNYDDAVRLVRTAEKAARKLRSVALVSEIRKRLERVEAMQKEYRIWSPFAKALRANPKDPEANLAMGKYYALVRGNWERGLALLAKGEKSVLQKAASADLAQPKTYQKQVDLAEMWRDAAKSHERTMRNHLLLRAYHWYQNALVDADSAKARKLVENRMEDILGELPPQYRVGKITTLLQECTGHYGPVYDGAFSPDGSKAISGSADGSVRLWDVKTGRQLRRFEGHSGPVWTVAFAPDGRRVLSGGFDNTIRLFDLASGRQIREFRGHTDYVRCVTFSRDGRFIASCGDDRTIRIWSTSTGAELRKLTGHDHFVWSVAFSPDGKKLVSGSLDRTVRIWDVSAGKELKKLTGHRDTVLSVDFAPDGRRVLSGSTDKTVKLWDITTGEELRTFTGHKGYVYSVSFSPDGRRALSTGEDRTLRLWDVYTGETLQVLSGHSDEVWSVTFSDDGRLALSTGQDRKVLIWGGER